MDFVTGSFLKRPPSVSKIDGSIADSGIDHSEDFCDKMDESSILEMDIDYVNRKLEENESEKSALTKRVELLEAELHEALRVALLKNNHGGKKFNENVSKAFARDQAMGCEASFGIGEASFGIGVSKSKIGTTVKKRKILKNSKLDRRLKKRGEIITYSPSKTDVLDLHKNIKLAKTVIAKNKLSKNSSFLPKLQSKETPLNRYKKTSTDCIRRPTWFREQNSNYTKPDQNIPNVFKKHKPPGNNSTEINHNLCIPKDDCLPSCNAIIDENMPIYITLSNRSCKLLRKCKSFSIILEDCLLEKSNKTSTLTLNNENISFIDVDDPSYSERCVVSKKAFVKEKYRRVKPNCKTFLESVPKEVSTAIIAVKRSLLKPRFRKIKFQALVNVLTSNFAYKSEDIVFYILKYLSLTEKFNPVLYYKKNPNISAFFAPIEKCFVDLLDHINSYSEVYDSILLTALLNIRFLILAIDNLSANGSGALCRLYALICKTKGYRKEALSFCCDILKVQHKYGPMLVATVACVWDELFDAPLSLSRREAIFYGSLRACALKWPVHPKNGRAGLTLSEWELSKSLLDKFMPSSIVDPDEDTIDFIIEAILDDSIEKPEGENFMMTNSLVLYAAYKGWNWAKQEIIDKHIVNHIGTFHDTKRNERLLTLFCKLYVEICIFYPSYNESDKLLLELFDLGAEDEIDKFMQNAAATALIQFYLHKKETLPKKIEDWYITNKNDPKFSYLELLFHRNALARKTDFTQVDIL